MAHFAKLNDDNKVIQICVVNNEILDPLNEEESGIIFLTEWSNGHTNWKQTSFNAKFRYNFAGIDYDYDPIDDAFIAPMPECGHESLILDDKKQWQCAECQVIAEQIRLEQNGI